MKVETKEDALIHCFDLWLWCAVTGKNKYDWPGWGFNGGYLNPCQFDCPCCEYVGYDGYEQNKVLCDECPISWGVARCFYGSVFLEWECARTVANRKTAALKIATLAMEALYRLYDAK